MDFESKTLSVDKLMLDLDNPRLYHKRLTDQAPETEAELETEIADDNEFMLLYRAIKKVGVTDPIWVKKVNGSYLVIEGNRRTVALRRLIAEDAEPPAGVRYDHVRTQVISKGTSELEIKLQKVRLQSGKRAWGAVNDAAVIFEFHNDLMMAIEDIAVEMGISITKVRKSLMTYKMFLEYVKQTGDTSTKRFTYFNESPKSVLDWVEVSTKHREEYYEWISPVSGKAKIRSAAAGRGSLREFAKVIEEPEALQLLREDPNATVEDAFEVVKANDVLKDMIFLKRVLPMAKSLTELSSNETQLSRLSAEPRLLVHIRSLKNACEAILDDIESME